MVTLSETPIRGETSNFGLTQVRRNLSKLGGGGQGKYLSDVNTFCDWLNKTIMMAGVYKWLFRNINV